MKKITLKNTEDCLNKIRSVIKKEGYRYLWKGNGVNLIKATPQYALTYSLFSVFTEKIDKNNFLTLNKPYKMNNL